MEAQYPDFRPLSIWRVDESSIAIWIAYAIVVWIESTHAYLPAIYKNATHVTTSSSKSNRISMALDLLLFRADQGGNPEKIRELMRKRFKDVTHVDKVVEADAKWRKR